MLPFAGAALPGMGHAALMPPQLAQQPLGMSAMGMGGQQQMPQQLPQQMGQMGMGGF